MSGNAQTPQKTKNRTKWPWGAQLFLAVTALATAVVLLIWIPMHAAPALVEESPGGASPYFSTMMAVFVGLATMTISGIFLFMTFRIDRGTRRTAREVAEKAAGKAGEKIGKKAAKSVAEKEIKEIAEREVDRLKKDWEKYFIEDIQEQKERLIEKIKEMIEKIKEMENLLNIQRDEFMKAVGKMEAVKKKVESDLEEIGQAGKKELKEIQKAAEKAINEASKNAVKSVEGAGNVAADAVRRTGENVRDGIRETEREEQSQVKKAGTDARERIEREMEDARKRLDQHVDRMVENARAKVDEADIEKLVDEKVRPFLERSPWARIFGSRPRAP